MKKKLTLLKRILVIFVLTMVLTTGFETLAGASFFAFEANAADTNYYMVDSVEEYVSTLREALLNREEEINIILTNGTITADQAKELYFQIAGHNGNPKEGDYIEHNTSGKYIGGEWVKINNVNYYCVEYEFDFFTTAAQEREVDEAVSALWSELDLDGCSDYEKIMRVCDYLTPIIEYDQDQKIISHSAYAAIVKHSAVCQGYALLFYRLMLELGIDCRYVRGEVSTDEGMESHAWNIVKLGDVYYNVDLTWDSGFAKRGGYRCMLRNEEEFNNHYRDEAYLTEEFQQDYPMAETSYPIEPEILVSPENGIGNAHQYVYLKGKVRLDTRLATAEWESREAGSEEWVAQPGMSFPDRDCNVQFLCTSEDDGDQYRLVIRDRDGNLLKATEPVTIHVMPYYKAVEWIWADDNSSAEVILASTVTDNSFRYPASVKIETDSATCYREGREYYYAYVAFSSLAYFDDEKEIRIIPIQDHHYSLDNVTLNYGDHSGVFYYYCLWCQDEILLTPSVEEQIISQGSSCGELTQRTTITYVDAETSPDHEEHRFEWDTSYYEPHDYGEPVWTWSDDYSYAEAAFTCRNNPEHTDTISYSTIKKETIEPTCTLEGKTIYTAIVGCQGEEYTDQKVVWIDKIGHVWSEEYEVDKAATCTEDGSESIHCLVCGETKEGSAQTIERLSHAYDEWVVTKEPICTEDGLRERICANCGDKITETIPATGHKWNSEYTVDKAATCTEEGSESIHCSVCGVIKEDSVQTIEKLPHAYGEWVVKKEATCTVDGSREKVCAGCGDKITETIPAGHQWNNFYTVDKEATYTEEGAESIHCSVCGEIKEGSQQVIPKLKRNPGWFKESGIWYYVKDDGTFAIGWLKSGSTWYYMDPSTCAMKTGWVKVNGSWYYMKDSGAMATGWVKSGNDWYYMSASGVMTTGWVKVGGSWYYMKASGAMASNEWCSGYWLNANGTWTYQPRGSWKKDSTGWWFGDTSGWYAKRTTIKIDGKEYTFDAKGYWVEE